MFSPVSAEQTIPRSSGLKQSLVHDHVFKSSGRTLQGRFLCLPFGSLSCCWRIQGDALVWDSDAGSWLEPQVFSTRPTSPLLAPHSLGPLSPGLLSVAQHPDFFMWLKPASVKVDTVWPFQPHRSLPPHSISRNKSYGQSTLRGQEISTSG